MTFDYHDSWGMKLGMFLLWLLVLGGGVRLLTQLFPGLIGGAGSESETGPETESTEPEGMEEDKSRQETGRDLSPRG